MGLGKNDALGIPRGINRGSKLVIAATSVSNGTTNIRVLRFTTVLENSLGGAAEFLQDVALGDRVSIKVSGLYSLSSSMTGGVNFSTGIFKNLESTTPAYLTAVTGDTYLSAPPTNKNGCLVFAYGNGSAEPKTCSITTWLTSGDIVWFISTTNPSTDSLLASVEYLGGT